MSEEVPSDILQHTVIQHLPSFLPFGLMEFWCTYHLM